MTELEFNITMEELMKIIDIKKIQMIDNTNDEIKDTYILNSDIILYFDTISNAFIKGIIPFELLKPIYEKYPSNPYKIYGINVINQNDNLKPINIERKNNNAYGIIDLYQNIPNENNSLIKKNKTVITIDFNSINMCCTNSKEGLVHLVLCIKKYLNPQLFTDSMEDIIDNLLNNINNRLFKTINPYITTYDWLKQHSDNCIIKDMNKTNLDKKIRFLLNELDQAANPFTNKENEIIKEKEYRDKIKISIGIDNKNYICIEDRKTEDSVICLIEDKQLIYSISYNLNDKNIIISHSFIIDEGEVLNICYDDNYLYYNITTGLIGELHSHKDPITNKIKQMIIETLETAVNISQSITIRNMYKQKETETDKQYLLKGLNHKK